MNFGQPVAVSPQTVIGPKAVEQVTAMKPGDVLLLENVRFVAGETIADKAKE